MAKAAFAIAAHPDDIEFMMAGTLLRLKNELGYEIHYMTIADGSLGSEIYDAEELAALRRKEAMAAAEKLGAVFHESICHDVEIFYNYQDLGKVVTEIRKVDPEIVITHGPFDYMEDHVNAGRLAASAAFCRGMKNFRGITQPICKSNVCVYHSLPLSLHDQLNKPIIPDMYVDITAQIPMKREALNCHRTQKEWLDASQGLDAYLDDMVQRGEAIGKLAGFCKYAEGFVRHNPCGYCPDDFDPLAAIARPASK